jgi:hypothetical protein
VAALPFTSLNPARSVLYDLRVLCGKTFLFTISEIVRTCDDFRMSTREQNHNEARSNDSDENTRFNGAELSESVLGRDWNSPQEEAAWSNL